MSTNTGKTNEAVFVFAEPIEQKNVANFVINLVNWSNANPNRPLRVNLNSGGGIILDGFALYEEFMLLRRKGHHLTIAVYGRAASCAGWLLQAADVRIIGSNSWILIHEITSSLNGSLTEMRREVKRCEDLQNQTFGLIAGRSNLTVAQLDKRTSEGGDWWLNAQESLDAGLVDVIEFPLPFAPYVKPTGVAV